MTTDLASEKGETPLCVTRRIDRGAGADVSQQEYAFTVHALSTDAVCPCTGTSVVCS